jgi:GntR family transcriptional regulator/MocR family aminotransferase
LGHLLGLKVDMRREEPIHQQVFEQIAGRIQSRTFPPGFRLPPTRALAQELAIHRNTIARAYADLEAAGFVSAAVGRGTFVESPADGPAGKATPSAASAEPASTTMPWSALVAHDARPEIVSRAERWALPADRRDVVNLARMQPSPDLLPEESFRRCMARVFATHGTDAMSYAPAEGVKELRELIASELVGRGVPAAASDILVTSGSQQALDLVARTLVNPGETVLVESTTYAGALDVFAAAGARIVSCACDADGPDPNALARLARPDVKALYVMPTGHNPSGRTMSLERRRALVAWSRAARVPIIEDDFAAGLSLEESSPPPHLRALDGDVLHLSSFSKRLIPGLRLGYIVAPPPVHRTLRALKRIVALGSSGLLERGLAEFMDRGYLRAHMTRVCREYRRRRDALVHALERNLGPLGEAGLVWRVPAHGIVLWLDLPASLDANEVHAEAQKHGVLVSPSPMWSADPSTPPGLRLAFCSEPPPRLAEGVRRLARVLKTLLARAARSSEERAVPRVIEAV